MQLKQVKMRDGLHAAFRDYACREGLLLKDAHDEAVSWFLGVAGDRKPRYLSSPREGKYRSLWLRPTLVAQVKAVSNKDNISQNRVIYTGLVLFMDEKNNEIATI